MSVVCPQCNTMLILDDEQTMRCPGCKAHLIRVGDKVVVEPDASRIESPTTPIRSL